LRPAQKNSFQDPISEMTRAKWTKGVAQAVPRSPEFKPQGHQKKKKKEGKENPMQDLDEKKERERGEREMVAKE
jgi:hypothetical protein